MFPTLYLPDKLRPELRSPFGEIVSNPPGSLKNAFLVCVGDESCRILLEKGFKPELIVFDGKVRRKPVPPLPETNATKFEADNPAGRITSSSWRVLRDAFSELPAAVHVDGEEDLLVLPCVLLAPENAVIAYGQPDGGLVLVRASKQKKDWTRALLERFSATP